MTPKTPNKVWIITLKNGMIQVRLSPTQPIKRLFRIIKKGNKRPLMKMVEFDGGKVAGYMSPYDMYKKFKFLAPPRDQMTEAPHTFAKAMLSPTKRKELLS